MAARILHVSGAGSAIINGVYTLRDASVVPASFALVCRASGWGAAETWARLNGQRTWFESPSASYIYFNRGDNLWWMDSGETGLGLYVSRAGRADATPPRDGWEVVGDGVLPLPTVTADGTGGDL